MSDTLGLVATCTVHFSSSIIVERLAEQAVVPVATCSEKGLSDSDVAQLQGAVDAAVQENMGMAMVYGLVTAAQEWLTDKARGAARLPPTAPPACEPDPRLLLHPPRSLSWNR